MFFIRKYSDTVQGVWIKSGFLINEESVKCVILLMLNACSYDSNWVPRAESGSADCLNSVRMRVPVHWQIPSSRGVACKQLSMTVAEVRFPELNLQQLIRTN